MVAVAATLVGVVMGSTSSGHSNFNNMGPSTGRGGSSSSFDPDEVSFTNYVSAMVAHDCCYRFNKKFVALRDGDSRKPKQRVQKPASSVVPSYGIDTNWYFNSALLIILPIHWTILQGSNIMVRIRLLLVAKAWVLVTLVILLFIRRPPMMHAPEVHLVSRPTTSRWHHHLCHHSSTIVNHVIRDNKLSVSGVATGFICDACQKAKSHKLPYSRSTSVSFFPLQSVSSDVWDHAPSSICHY